MNYPISLCYHPTKLVLIDDSQEYLKETTLRLKKNYVFYTFSEPSKAIEFFRKLHNPSFFIERCVKTQEDLPPEHIDFRVDLRCIYQQELKRKNRFEEIAIAIIDYAMPGMNGIHLSRELKAIYPNLQIILLTGEADENLAIKAFNEGLIEQYIKKLTPNLSQQLQESILRLQNNYFSHLSETIINKISKSTKKELKRLQDPAIIELFNKTLHQNNIIEYYILEINGNFLLIDQEGKPFWLIILAKSEVDDFYEHIKPSKMSPELMILLKQHPERDEKAIPNAVLSALKNKEKIPFFFTDEQIQSTAPWDWEPYLHKANVIKGNFDTYYFALTSNTTLYEWPPKNFISYRDYLGRNRH